MQLKLPMLTSNSQPAEYMAIEDTYNPLVHRMNQAIKRRAVQPDEPIPLPAKILIKYSNPPSELVSDSTKELSTLVKVADVKKGMFVMRFLHLTILHCFQFHPKPKGNAAENKSNHCPVLTWTRYSAANPKDRRLRRTTPLPTSNRCWMQAIM
jgi:hypothetical protein